MVLLVMQDIKLCFQRASMIQLDHLHAPADAQHRLFGLDEGIQHGELPQVHGRVIILREPIRLFTVIAGERIVSSWQQQAAAQRDDLLHLGALDERDQDDRQGEKRITQRPVQEPALVLLQRLHPAHDS